MATVLVFAAVAVSGIDRQGYSIDEEYTLFGVRGILAHGVPILPSGALYDCGLPYTYAAWLSGALFGHGFPAYRLPSLLSAATALVLAFRLARIAQGSTALAIIATAAAAALPWTIFGAQWARFYAMFIAVMLASVLLFVRSIRTGRGMWWWLGSIWVAHLLHEFAILLILLPACVWMSEDEKKPVIFPYRTTALALAAFLAAEGTVVLLHFTVSGVQFRTIHDYAALHALPVGWELPGQPGGDRPYLLFDAERWSQVLSRAPLALAGAVVGAVAARRLQVSPLLAAVQGALTAVGQFARIWLLAVVWVFGRPRRLVRTLLWTAAVVTLGAVILTLQNIRGTGAVLSWPLVSGILVFAFREALSTISALLQEYPGTVVCLAAAAALAGWRRSSRSAVTIRLLLLWVLWWLLAFDVLRVDFKPRYYAPFWVLLVIGVVPAARCIPAAWFARRRVAIAVRVAAGFVVAATIVWEQVRQRGREPRLDVHGRRIDLRPETAGLRYDRRRRGARPRGRVGHGALWRRAALRSRARAHRLLALHRHDLPARDVHRRDRPVRWHADRVESRGVSGVAAARSREAFLDRRPGAAKVPDLVGRRDRRGNPGTAADHHPGDAYRPAPRSSGSDSPW